MGRQQPHKRKWTPWVLPMALLAAWWAATAGQWVPPYLLPPPAQVLAAAKVYAAGDKGPMAGRFFADAAASLVRVGAGFSLAVALGLPLGLVSGRRAAVNRFLSATINGLRAVPGIAWLPLALVWFGIGLKTTVFLVALAAFFPVYLNAQAGARNVPELWLQAGAMMGASGARGVFRVLVPGAMPHVVTGLRLGLGISWAYLVLGELTGVPHGLGAAIMDARMLGRLDLIVAGILIIALLGRATDRLLVLFLTTAFSSARRRP
ncbi:MAG: ABC transporter permease [Deltaproteobacteria bacterium]|nr:ABC transporter permease [Deltaproteobacteria bacterium]